MGLARFYSLVPFLQPSRRKAAVAGLGQDGFCQQDQEYKASTIDAPARLDDYRWGESGYEGPLLRPPAGRSGELAMGLARLYRVAGESGSTIASPSQEGV